MKRAIIIIDIVGTIISVGLLAASYYIKTVWWQSVVLSFSLNVLTSLLLLNFVDRVLDSQDEKKEKRRAKKQEKNAIINYHKVTEVLFEMYVLEYNQLTIPICNRSKNNRFTDIDSKHLNKSFGIPELCDFAQMDILPFNALGKTIIHGYRDIFNRMCVKFLCLFTNCSFEYYPEIRDVISEIIKESEMPNGIDTLIGFTNWQKKELVLKNIGEMISTYSGNPDEDFANGKYNGNLFLSVVLLYEHLIRMRNLMDRYMEEIEKILGDVDK